MRALLIGGTGTLGRALLPKLMRRGYQIRILSRDELKQAQMKDEFRSPGVTIGGVEFVIGDVRDRESLQAATLGCEVVFHLAAMKHVDIAEENVLECIKINLMGTLNVIDACVNNGVSYAVFSSTDKAVLPINTYGFCKGLAERAWHDANRREGPLFTVFRWGNVVGSRGSVLHAFKESLTKYSKVLLTDPRMTRFWIHIDDAANFMLDSFKFANGNQTYVPPIKGATVANFARAVATHLDISNFDFEKIAIRPGEKLHEWLDFHDPDFEVKSNTCEQYSDEELLALVGRSLGGK